MVEACIMKKKIATKKGEPRIHPTTTRWIVEQYVFEGRKAKDIWRDISDRCSYGYVKAVIKNPLAYLDKNSWLKITTKLQKVPRDIQEILDELVEEGYLKEVEAAN
jgi:predicted transcriptional regulator